MRVLVIDVGGTHVKLMHTGSTETAQVRLGRRVHAPAGGRRRQGAHRRLDLRRRHHRHPQPCHSRRASTRSPGTSARAGSASTGRRRFGVPVKHHERRRHAGARQRRGRPHAVSRPRLRARHRAGRRGRRSSPWNWRTCRSRIRPSKTCSGQRGLAALGDEAWRPPCSRARNCCAPPWRPNTWCSAAATSRLFDGAAGRHSPRPQRQGVRRRLPRVGPARAGRATRRSPG